MIPSIHNWQRRLALPSQDDLKKKPLTPETTAGVPLESKVGVSPLHAVSRHCSRIAAAAAVSSNRVRNIRTTPRLLENNRLASETRCNGG
jgi:hypothetical protein